MAIVIDRFRQYGFLFEELVKRDFKKKYKRTVLGILWSLLGPMLQLLVMAFVFTRIFGGQVPHFVIYLFSGNLVFSYFKESTGAGMGALMANSGIIAKVKVPKYIFLLSKNVSSLINFSLTLIIYFIFVAFERIPFSPRFLLLLYPVVCLLLFNIGMGLILSALHVFFKDIQYLYDIFTLMVMYLSAIFYTIDMFPENIQRMFLLNPVFVYISYFRTIVLDRAVPPFHIHLLCIFYAFLAVLLGSVIYKKWNYKFVYYM